MLAEWPVLSHLFGLKPGDERRLTPRELALYRAEGRAWVESRTREG